MNRASRRDFLKIGVGAVGGGLAAILGQRIAPSIHLPRRRKQKPNVVIMLLDALRADHVGCYGYRRKDAHGEPASTTPNMDRLAREGAMFSEAYASSSVTMTSMFSLHSGYERPTFDPLYESRYSCVFPTFPEVFRDHGWRTRTISQNPFHYMCSWNTRGYAEEDILLTGRHVERGRLVDWWHAESAFKVANEELLASVEEPFMWYIHLLPPHEPYDAPEKFYAVFDDGYKGKLPKEIYYESGEHSEAWADVAAKADSLKGTIGKLPAEDRKQLEALEKALQSWHGARASVDRIRQYKDKLSAMDIEHVKTLYDANIYQADWFVGALVTRLRLLGLLDNTIVIVTSDHGEEFMEHGGIAHDGTVYEEDIHIPLIFKLPGGALGGRRVGDLVSMVDIPATILDLAGIQDELGVGRSFGALLRGEASPRKRERVYSDCVGVATREGTWKHIMYDWEVPGGDGGMLRKNTGLREVELYDLSNDPGERKNLAEAHPDMARRFGERAKSWVEEGAEIWMEKSGSFGGPESPRGVPVWNEELMREIHVALREGRLSGKVERVGKEQLEFDKRLERPDYGLSREQVERLKALGYIR